MGALCHLTAPSQPFLGFLLGEAFPKGSPLIPPQARPPLPTPKAWEVPTPTWAGPDRCPGASRWAELEGKEGLRRGWGGQGIRWRLGSCIIIAVVLIKKQSPPNEPPATTVLLPPPSCPSTHPRNWKTETWEKMSWGR